MSETARPLTIAFVLASYTDSAAAGMERATAALARGLRQLGHRALILSAASPAYRLHDELRLEFLDIGFPCTDDDLRHAVLKDQTGVACELTTVFEDYGVDIAVYVDALWGLGRIAPPSGIRSVLAMHVLGHGDDLRPALERADQVIAPSPTVLSEAEGCGYDTTGWQIIPNALLHEHTPPPDQRREALRRHGPMRVLARLGPEKNVRALLDAGRLVDRQIQVITAEAGFETADGAQEHELTKCQYSVAHLKAGTISGTGLSWGEVQPWLAQASVVIVPSTRETFGLVALEAMSVGTPVVAFDVGNLPALIGEDTAAGGLVVPRSRGEDGLWRAAEELLSDPLRYGELSRAAYYRSRDYLPTTVAETFLKAVS